MTPDGLVTRRSVNGFAQTLDLLTKAVKAKGLSVFATIDHAAGAEAAGLALRPTVLVIFGNARGGTPLMQEVQTAGIDLPLKALIWEDLDGAVNVSVNDVAWLARRHGIADAKAGGLTTMLDALLKEATGGLTFS